MLEIAEGPDGTLWDSMRSPYSLRRPGFRITKQLAYVAVAQRPGVRCLGTGFFGDPMNRGSLDRVGGKLRARMCQGMIMAVLITSYPGFLVSSHTACALLI